MNTKADTTQKASGKPELPRMEFGGGAGELYRIRQAEAAKQAQSSPLPWEAEISEANAKLIVASVNGYAEARQQLDVCNGMLQSALKYRDEVARERDTARNHAGKLADALRDMVDESYEARKYIVLDNENGFSAYTALGKAKKKAMDELAAWEGAQ